MYPPAGEQKPPSEPSQLTQKTAPDPSVPANTFYRRTLPSCLISFTSEEGKKIFKESVFQGYAETYFSLANNFTTQSEPAYCGPSSLAMALNALEIDPSRRRKGKARWYSDELLEGCAPKEEVKRKGITFTQFYCLAENHCDVVAKRGDQVSFEEFVEDVKRVSSSGDEHMVVSFSRKTLQQTGDGHFSPLGGYNIDRKLALVLDVARFKYPCYYAPIEMLYESLKPIDKSTGQSRGYFLLKASEQLKSPNFLGSCGATCGSSGSCHM
ncbi:Phytochelatin-domain-containing protein [Basidiobolus meristosporus CBS 931.73]|uniref:glutathione gamma-glutamylcysteinyltransferase n=1 Tax=Basidiobolus meristosporus CBS 931.73 TaxID=1314790 RepID=A0A1Y1Y1Q7_9FUNG|nr:Phytochelatin-domain-containing protein [Basidiobolus meristosporus CBS 931.73]|eukprot:ORX91825.1 Phytochelatin-domain-containing protein [Basidiobolus meristosporus CBS 931.73]